jgi:hypothetical protein
MEQARRRPSRKRASANFKLIREELTAAQKPAETKKSWAAVAATAATNTITAAHQPALAATIVPARHLREVVVRAEGATEDLKKRTAKEVVAAVNTASDLAVLFVRSSVAPSARTTTSRR